MIHRPRSAFDELKHPEFFEVFGDAAGARAVVAELDNKLRAADPHVAESFGEVRVASAAQLAGQKRRRTDDDQEDQKSDSDSSEVVVV